MKRAVIFTSIAFALTWGLCLYLKSIGGLYHPAATLFLAVCMLIPALSSVITRLVTKEGFKKFYLAPHFKGNLRTYALAWIIMPVLIAAGAAVFFIIYPKMFDPGMAAFSQAYGIDPNSMKSVMVFQIAQAVLLSPILNFIPALGEELGWRGYLLPKLTEKFRPKTAVLISGIIWGIWHAPMIAMGHNYGLDYKTAPWGGILAMIVFCMAAGAIFSWFAYKTESAVPAAILHGSLNGFASAPVLFLASANFNPFTGPLPVGIIGGCGILFAGIFCYFRIMDAHRGSRWKERDTGGMDAWVKGRREE